MRPALAGAMCGDLSLRVDRFVDLASSDAKLGTERLLFRYRPQLSLVDQR